MLVFVLLFCIVLLLLNGSLRNISMYFVESDIV